MNAFSSATASSSVSQWVMSTHSPSLDFASSRLTYPFCLARKLICPSFEAASASSSLNSGFVLNWNTSMIIVFLLVLEDNWGVRVCSWEMGLERSGPLILGAQRQGPHPTQLFP